MAAKAYDWLKAVQTELVQKKELTYSGAPKGFAWETLSQKLGARFQLPDLVIQGSDPEWGSQEDLQKKAGKSPWPLSFALGNLPGLVTFYLPKDDVGLLLTIALSHQQKGTLYPDEEFLEAFYQFLAVEVLAAMAATGFDPSVAPRLVSEAAPIPNGKMLRMEISISTIGRVLQGQIIAPEEFVIPWNEQFKAAKPQKEVSPEMAAAVELNVHLEAGEAQMTKQELGQIQPGDFLLLNTCTINPEKEGGQVTLTTNGIPLFRGMLQRDSIKIVEYPLFQKVEPTMDVDENNAEADSGEQQPPGTKIGSIPISLKIEVGQIRMSLEKLMELQPGATLPLNIDPEEGVDLVINGKCIGKGELLRLGETLGVRILEIG